MIEQLKSESKRLKELQQSCEEQLEKLKQVGKAHQNQIDTLLKFNERLLGIIENQFNTATKNKISSDLQIISQTNEGTNDYNTANKLANKLNAPPQMKGNFQHQDLQGFEDQQEEEIYNKEMPSPESSPIQQPIPPPKTQKIQYLLPKADPTKATKLDKVYEMHHHKDEEVSINLSNSYKTNQAQSLHSLSKKQAAQQNGQNSETQPELQQLKDMIKQYRQQFVDNSSEYQQICEIIHNDLLNDLQEFKRIEQQSKRFYESKISQVNNLRNQIRRFKPINELQRIMKKLNVPSQTERLLNQKIVSKYQ